MSGAGEPGETEHGTAVRSQEPGLGGLQGGIRALF